MDVEIENRMFNGLAKRIYYCTAQVKDKNGGENNFKTGVIVILKSR
jgi:hypothetical protein